MNKERLMLVVKKLEELPPERFNFNVWVGTNWEGDPDLSCGTTACALGWATTIPELREAGLRLTKAICCTIVCIVFGDQMGVHSPNDASISAAKAVFELTNREASFLFVPNVLPSDFDKEDRPGSEATAKEVAAHIKAFVERGGLPEGYENW
jgi:hypothetical protein